MVTAVHRFKNVVAGNGIVQELSELHFISPAFDKRGENATEFVIAESKVFSVRGSPQLERSRAVPGLAENGILVDHIGSALEFMSFDFLAQKRAAEGIKTHQLLLDQPCQHGGLFRTVRVVVLEAGDDDAVARQGADLCFELRKSANRQVGHIKLRGRQFFENQQTLVVVQKNVAVVTPVLKRAALRGGRRAQPVGVKRGAGDAVEVPACLLHVANGFEEFQYFCWRSVGHGAFHYKHAHRLLGGQAMGARGCDLRQERENRL